VVGCSFLQGGEHFAEPVDIIWLLAPDAKGGYRKYARCAETAAKGADRWRQVIEVFVNWLDNNGYSLCMTGKQLDIPFRRDEK